MDTSKPKNIDLPAFADGRNPGLTIRQYACIHLKLPLSGDPELDRLIGIAQKRDMALETLNGVLSHKFDEPGENRKESVSDAIEYSEEVIQQVSLRKSPKS